MFTQWSNRVWFVISKWFSDVPGQCNQDSEWQCVDQRSFIDKRRRCDGYGDCADLSDEDEQLCYNCKLLITIDSIASQTYNLPFWAAFRTCITGTVSEPSSFISCF